MRCNSLSPSLIGLLRAIQSKSKIIGDLKISRKQQHKIHFELDLEARSGTCRTREQTWKEHVQRDQDPKRPAAPRKRRTEMDQKVRSCSAGQSNGRKKKGYLEVPPSHHIALPDLNVLNF